MVIILPIPEAPPVTRAERLGLSSIFLLMWLVMVAIAERERGREKQRGRDEISRLFFFFFFLKKRTCGF